MRDSTLGSSADLLSGKNTATTKWLSMQWRERTSSDFAASLISDVLNLSGMANSGSQTDKFTLRMSYSPSALSNDAETTLAAAGQIYLVSYNVTTSLWENAVLSNFGTSDVVFMGVGSSPDGVLGHYGISTTSNTVWAVLDHNSQFAVVPEPSAIALLCAGAASFLARRRRLRKVSGIKAGPRFGRPSIQTALDSGGPGTAG
jgi:hypothetical protein